MKNGKFNVYPTRVALDQAKAVAAGMPFWFTQADEMDLHAARKGCEEPERNCIECCVECCPEARRMCRVCAEWRSGSGVAGDCAITGNITLPVHTCGKWRARG